MALIFLFYMRFHKDISLANSPDPADDAVVGCVSYIRNINQDAVFVRDIIMWLTEERRKRHRECMNQSRNIPIRKHSLFT